MIRRIHCLGVAFVTLLAVWGLAIWWTYAPPQLPLFVDPTDGSRGIPLR